MLPQCDMLELIRYEMEGKGVSIKRALDLRLEHATAPGLRVAGEPSVCHEQFMPLFISPASTRQPAGTTAAAATLSLISPRTLKVKNISVMIMHCLFILSKATSVSTEWARAKPSLLGRIKTLPHMYKRQHHRQLESQKTINQNYLTWTLVLQCFHICKL